MTWKQTLGLGKDPLEAYLEDPTDPANTARLVQEAEPADLEEYINTLAMLPALSETYLEAQQNGQEIGRAVDEYNREMGDAALKHRGRQLQDAWYGLGDVATGTGYGAGNFVSNAASGTVDAAGDIGVSTVDAVYDVLEARKERKDRLQAS